MVTKFFGQKSILELIAYTFQRKHLYKALSKAGPFSDEDWVPGPETIDALETSKILYVIPHLDDYHSN